MLKACQSLKKCIALSCIIYVFIGCSDAKSSRTLSKTYPVIPTPQEIRYGNEDIQFNSINIQSNEFENEGKLLADFFKSNQLQNSSNGLLVELRKANIANTSSDEAYALTISNKLVISAPTPKGIFYGIQTLKQLFRKHGKKGVLPKVSITDWPAFKIRGFMHDTGRNFQSVAQLKEQIEVLAQYKYNVFHWHLTDNPGWRLESKMYPELQLEHATTRQKGKYYTQEDFKAILAFCKERNITVIPELDIPGHTEAFRKALDIETMNKPKVKPILLDLFQELMDLADASQMPYIHIGTDEVKAGIEHISNDVILEIMDLIKKNNRETIVWKAGITVEEDSTSINQLWAQHKARKGHRFIDSRSNYINHLDPFAGMSRLYFQQPCQQEQGDNLALGGILCAWPDNNIGDERDILTQNPIYPSIVFYADAIWKGRTKDYPEYWAQLPPKGSPEFNAFKIFEQKVITHRDLFFKGKEFQYIVQTNKYWKLIGPFNHQGDFTKSFPVEQSIKATYKIDDQLFKWSDTHTGGTIHLKHFFGFPAVTSTKSGTFYAYTNIFSPDDRIQDFWIGFQGWSRSGRRGGPTPNIGQWHTTDPKIWVNNQEIAPPVWKQPNLGTDTHEIPFIDEDYFYRSPTKIQLKKGRNTVLLKIPHGGNSWKWMFTCIPVRLTKNGIKEVSELLFSTKFENK
ncbi:family 20 glycosylhydrolase [Snuella sedimenti]|uniref:beta-N-acetylhexosaminidase n=1 Tax=Snuella sedimenti TaxID=2798802 RepID=A0A8J7IN85_9FLAO|nr:family 20 glycosylhydrolase [Snuella sedimenti]MBJ6367812.1 beta-N-acetylhexosaminidase [Snuella sedimenti]